MLKFLKRGLAGGNDANEFTFELDMHDKECASTCIATNVAGGANAIETGGAKNACVVPPPRSPVKGEPAPRGQRPPGVKRAAIKLGRRHKMAATTPATSAKGITEAVGPIG